MLTRIRQFVHKRGAFLAALPLLALPSPATAQLQPAEPIWQRGEDVLTISPCPPGGDSDASCRALSIAHGGKITLLGAGYIQARILWTSASARSMPSLVVLGDDGGSGGLGDLFVIALGRALTVRKLRGTRMDSVIVHRGGAVPSFQIPFDIEYFNGAPHSAPAIVMLPVRWKNDGMGGDFDLDVKNLATATPTRRALEVQTRAAHGELRPWARVRPATANLYPPEASAGSPITVQTLAALMLSGHADLARKVLQEAWPHEGPTGDEDAFWKDLCSAIVRQPLWIRLDMRRLPHADMIVAASAAHG